MLAPEIGPWEAIDLVAGNARTLMLEGPPGTGKTYAAQRLGLQPDQKVFSITLTEDTPAAELRGHYVPGVDPDTGLQKFIWQDGPAVSAWREAARLVINEIDHASADVLSLLYVILESNDTAVMTLPTGETVKPKRGFTVVATMNGHMDELPEALRSRFPIAIHVNEIAPKALERLPADLREIARQTALVADEEMRISLRHWYAYAVMRERMAPEKAARIIFRDRADDLLVAIGFAEAPHVVR